MPKLTRRNFLKLGAVSGALLAGSKTLQAMELKLGGEDRHQIRPFHPRATYNYVCSLCPYHDAGIAFIEGGKVVKLEGNPDHIATRGKFCPKGLAGFLAAYDPDRILYPLKRTGQRGEGKWKRITWDEAIKEVSGKIKTAIDNKGAANEVALNTGEYKDSALLRFMHTIGSDSIFRSRALSLSNPNKKKALEDAFGVDALTPDFANARYVLNFGANIVETAFPFAQRLTDGIVEKRLKLVTFDVRLSNTAGRSDEWFPIFPGTDGIVMLAMANVIMSEGLADVEFLKNWTNVSVDKLTAHLKQFTPEKASESSGVNAEDIKRIAIDFAETKPNVVFTQNGVTYHSNGTLQERAAILLSAITGSVDAKGGLCLPRKFDVHNPKLNIPLTPTLSPLGRGSKGEGESAMNYTLPFKIKDGSQKASIFLNYMSNPAYSSPAASVWRDVLKDEKLVPFIVDFSPFMSETAELADIILPDVVSIERHDVVSAPTALKPWVSITKPIVKPQGEAMDVRITMQKIAKAIDADGSKGIASSWAFKDEAEYVKKQVEESPAIKDKYEELASNGMYPVYGKLDSKGRKIVDENGNPVAGDYGIYKKGGFATASKKVQINIKELEKIGLGLPVWQENPRHKGLKPNEFVLTTFKWAYHTNSRTSNLKYLSEIIHSNPVWLNKKEAIKLGIKDGGLVRVVSPVGHIVTKAFVTNGINPKVVAIGASVGRWAYGRVAQANLHMESPVKSNLHDNDIDDNLWWRDKGVNPNDIIPLSIDVIGGGQAWFDTVIKIESAHPEDKYGDVMVDNNKHMSIYKEMVKA